MSLTRTPSNRISIKTDVGFGKPLTPVTIQEDKNGQDVVNSGAGTARKPNPETAMYMVDAAGNKIEATIGKGRFETIKKESAPATGTTNKSETPPGDTQSGGTTSGQTYTTNKTNTGTTKETVKDSGIGAMLGQSSGEGLTHSWDKEAKQYADKLYQQGKAEAESEYSVKASELKTEAQTSQEDLEMQKYTNAQTADKLGWTGGYILDQQRQMSVLKAGIQAQLFNTQELNRLGLESSLAAARLNADLKNQELAHQYYQDAVTNAINTANVTGYYLSPEASDYLTQQRAAEQIMATSNPNSAEYAKAQNVINYVDNYFSENGLSKQGVKTLALMSHELQQDQFELEKKQLEISYIMASKQSTEYTEGKAGLYYDASGNTAFAGTSGNDNIGSGPDLINFSSIEPTELERICNLNPDGKNASFYEQCVTYKLEEIAKLYNNFLSTQKLTASEESWKKFQENPTNKALIDNFNAIKNIKIKTFDKETVLKGTAIPTGNFTLDSSLNVTFTKASKQEGNDVDTELQNKLDQVDNNNTLTDAEKEDKKQEIIDDYNKQSVATNLGHAREGFGADDMDNNYGDRNPGNNMSIRINGTRYNVQTGKKVIADSATYKALEAVSSTVGAVVSYKGALYVRDNTTWYIIEKRPNGDGNWFRNHWKELSDAIGFAPSNRTTDLE
jgi:hypothetical protein